MIKGATKVPKFVWRAVVLSFLLQVVAIGVAHTYRFRTTDNHFAFGWEMGCIGRALALGRGFSDPFCVSSGPSAWEPPAYPYLIGATFKVLGIYSNASAWTLLTINCLFSALNCAFIFLIARKIFGDKVARCSVWAWALLPYTWYWSVHWVWDTTISPMFLSAVVWIAVELEEWEGLRGWVFFGLLWGFIALLNPSLLSFLLVCGLWVWYRRSKKGKPSIPGIGLASLLFVLCISPWLMRNYEAFGRFVFIRDDFGQQLRLGNGPGAKGVSMVYLQPNLNPAELDRFRAMGELPYAEERKREAVEFIKESPSRFLGLSLKRFVYYWVGIPKADDPLVVAVLRNAAFLLSSVLALWGLIRALRHQQSGAWLLGLLVLSYPAVYYFVYAHARYRHPIEPELIILIVYCILNFKGRIASSSQNEPAKV